MDYKKVLRLHFVTHLSCREIAGTRMRPQRSRSLSLPSPTVITFTLKE